MNELQAFGYKFIRWGSKLFITGLVIGLIPIAHYMVGGVGHKVGDVFLDEVTLWFGCPAEKMVQIVQVGGLSLFIIGLCYLFIARSSDRAVSSSERLGLNLCVVGLIAEAICGGVIYLVLDYVVSPNFYFTPNQGAKVFWLAIQLGSFAIYVWGIVLVLGGVKQAIETLMDKSPSTEFEEATSTQ